MPNNPVSQPVYFAVLRGRKPGIYLNWADCEQNIKGFPGAMYNIFYSHDQARDFLNQPLHNARSINNGSLLKQHLQQLAVQDIRLAPANNTKPVSQASNSKKETKPPASQASTPKKETKPPASQASTPKKETKPPASQASTPKKETKPPASQASTPKKETKPVAFATQELGASSSFNKTGCSFLPKRIKRSRSTEKEDDKRRIKLPTMDKPLPVVIDVSSLDNESSDDMYTAPSKPAATTTTPPAPNISGNATDAKQQTENLELVSPQRKDKAPAHTTIVNEAPIPSTTVPKTKIPDNATVTKRQPENPQRQDPQKVKINFTRASSTIANDAFSVNSSIASPVATTSVPKQQLEGSRFNIQKDVTNIATATTNAMIVSNPLSGQKIEDNNNENQNNSIKSHQQQPNNVGTEMNRIAPEKLNDIDRLLKRIRTAPPVLQLPKEIDVMDQDERKKLQRERTRLDALQHDILMEGAKRLDELVQFHIANDKMLKKKPQQQEGIEQLIKAQARQEELEQRLRVWERQKDDYHQQLQQHKLREQQENLRWNQKMNNNALSSNSLDTKESKAAQKEPMITNADDDSAMNGSATTEEDKIMTITSVDDDTATNDYTTTTEDDKMTITNTDDDTTTNSYITAEEDIMAMEEELPSSFDSHTETDDHELATDMKKHEKNSIIPTTIIKNTTSSSSSQSILSAKESLQQRVKDLDKVKKEANATVVQVMTWLKECAENDWITTDGENLNDCDLEEIMSEVVEIRKRQK